MVDTKRQAVQNSIHLQLNTMNFYRFSQIVFLGLCATQCYYLDQNYADAFNKNKSNNIQTQTNNLTVIEGFPVFLQSNLSGKQFVWHKDSYPLKSVTNNFLYLDGAVEADEGQYTIQSENSIVIFNVAFRRSIDILINNTELNNNLDSNGKVEVQAASQITLIPCIDTLPIRYTLDGSEPTERSKLYTTPFTINKSVYLRAKICIPETDSTRIRVLYEAE